MRIKLFFRTAAVALLLAATGLVASAQTLVVMGKVTMKQADGTEKPVEGAQIDLIRTDIKQEFHTKTNKKGEYTHAGMPYGTFMIAVSAPGARPAYVANVPVARQPNNNFSLQPGDGSKLTLEQMKAGVTTGPAAAAAPPTETADAKKAREDYEKEVARVAEANKKIEDSNVVVKREFEAGNTAFTAKNYDEAVAAYDRAIAAQPDQAVVHLNKSIALRIRAVEKYNTAAKAKDKAGTEAARADFKNAAESADKAVKFYREKQGAAGAAPAAPAGATELMGYLSARMEGYRLALQTNAGIDASLAVPAMEEYIVAETDPVKKAKAEAGLGNALFMSGQIDASIAAYRKVLASNPTNLDALFGLGIALASDPEGKYAAEARDALKDFASKAPATDGRKADAESAVAALEESMKPKSAPKGDTGGKRRTRP
ncbi:MAG TPA: tetratricopeptide repeat protein [Pyrinomonadaceae bacterium]